MGRHPTLCSALVNTSCRIYAKKYLGYETAGPFALGQPLRPALPALPLVLCERGGFRLPAQVVRVIRTADAQGNPVVYDEAGAAPRAAGYGARVRALKSLAHGGAAVLVGSHGERERAENNQ